MAVAFTGIDYNCNISVKSVDLHRSSYKRRFYRTFDRKCVMYLFTFLAMFLFMFQLILDSPTCHSSNVSVCLNDSCSFEDTHRYPYGVPSSNGSRQPLPGTKQRLPQVLIIGVRKGGTRALLEMLNLHPDIQKAPTEVHFFDRRDRYALGLEWYRRQMPFTFEGQLTVEKSPSYFVTPEAPRRVCKMSTATRLLLIVRDPVVRLLSDFTQIEATRNERKRRPRSFEDVALLSTGEVNAQYKAIQVSLYASYLQQWLELFPLEQIHVIDGDRLIWDPWSEVRKIEKFLKLQPKIRQDQFYFNSTKGFYCLKQGDSSKCLADTKGRKHPEVSNSTIHTFRIYFAAFNKQFFSMIGRNFSWPNS